MQTFSTGAIDSDVRVYVDSSALVKRSIEEPESDALDAVLEAHVDGGGALLSSSLAWIEVGRALRSRLTDDRFDEATVNEAIEVAMSGIAERAMTTEVVSLARRIAPATLRALDAVHLATAIVLDADLVVVYDGRLADACRHHGLAVVAPGSGTQEI